MRRSPATFSAYVLSDLAKTSRNLTHDPGVVSLHLNKGYFRPQLGGLRHLPGVPHHHVNMP